jgi:acetolactate decarboxylase
MAARVLLGVLLAASCGCGNSSDASEAPPRHALFQVSTIGALTRGDYDGTFPVPDLVNHGDFGLGTFDRVDGEMVVLDGVTYRVRTDGAPRVADASSTTPFAAVTNFVADETFSLDEAADFSDLQTQLDGHLSTPNAPVAIRIEGRIPQLTVRSVPAQQVPYPPLTDVIANQVVFELNDVSGTLVGFRTPSFLSELNASGHHFHFLSDDRAAGGHVLGGRFDHLRVEIQYLRDFEMWLPPAGSAFDSADLSPTPCGE